MIVIGPITLSHISRHNGQLMTLKHHNANKNGHDVFINRLQQQIDGSLNFVEDRCDSCQCDLAKKLEQSRPCRGRTPQKPRRVPSLPRGPRTTNNPTPPGRSILTRTSQPPPHRTLNHLTTSASARRPTRLSPLLVWLFSSGRSRSPRGDGGGIGCGVRRHDQARAAARRIRFDFALLLCRSGVGWLEDAADAARRHFLHRFFVFLSSCRLSCHPRACAPCGAASCHVMQGGDRDLDRHHDDCGGPSNEREL